MGEEKKPVGEIYKAMAAILQELGPIPKTGKNEEDSYLYVKNSLVYLDVNKAFKRHSIFQTSDILDVKTDKIGTGFCRVITVKYWFHAADGSCISSTAVGEGRDYGDKASSKAMVAAHKIALLQVFCMPSVLQIDPEADLKKPSADNAKSQEGKKSGGYSEADGQRKYLIDRGVAIMMNASDAEKNVFKAKTHKIRDLSELEEYVVMIEKEHGKPS